MYDWLTGALQGNAVVVTANRRLARTLRAEFARQQHAAGQAAWLTPKIYELSDWAQQMAAAASPLEAFAGAIGRQHSKILWERCIRREVRDPLLNVGALAQQAKDSWERLQQWRVSVEEIEASARNQDQRLYARSAAAYRSILAREGWLDSADVLDVVIASLERTAAAPLTRLTLAGFDRLNPQLERLVTVLDALGCEVATTPRSSSAISPTLEVFADGDAELRAAGVWARQRLAQDPGARLGIVVPNLERRAARALRLVKEGLIPGWQAAPEHAQRLINISYGRRFSEFPLVANALLLLQWLHRDLNSVEIGVLLRSDLLGAAAGDARCRHELRLRDIPQQSWSPQALIRFLQPPDPESDSAELAWVAQLGSAREQLPARQLPREWVASINQLLQAVGWPGAAGLSSEAFQAVNRWRELLNDVARLEVVVPSMTLPEMLARTTTIANETLYQAESPDAPVQVMGPLEAAGLQFDGLRVLSSNAANWPPPARPLTLVARQLQRDRQMPDCTPADTLQFAERVIERLRNSADSVVFSYAKIVDGVEHSASQLLAAHDTSEVPAAADPGWYATTLRDTASLQAVAADPVPAVAPTEKVHGGAGLLQAQRREPFTAFAKGRLGVRELNPFQAGLAPFLRGNLIHAALHRLYNPLPTQEELVAWLGPELETKAIAATQAAFRRLHFHADATLVHLLHLEEARVASLLNDVVHNDAQRPAFRLLAVEAGMDANIAGLPLSLRLDRLDQDTDGEQIVLDYKTGSPPGLLDRDQNLKDLQLAVYAYVLSGPVSAVGLYQVDSRAVGVKLAGRGMSKKLDWDLALPRWFGEVDSVAKAIVGGDVRINTALPVQDARPLSLLSRAREQHHG